MYCAALFAMSEDCTGVFVTLQVRGEHMRKRLLDSSSCAQTKMVSCVREPNNIKRY